MRFHHEQSRIGALYAAGTSFRSAPARKRLLSAMIGCRHIPWYNKLKAVLPKLGHISYFSAHPGFQLTTGAKSRYSSANHMISSDLIAVFVFFSIFLLHFRLGSRLSLSLLVPRRWLRLRLRQPRPCGPLFPTLDSRHLPACLNRTSENQRVPTTTSVVSTAQGKGKLYAF